MFVDNEQRKSSDVLKSTVISSTHPFRSPFFMSVTRTEVTEAAVDNHIKVGEHSLAH